MIRKSKKITGEPMALITKAMEECVRLLGVAGSCWNNPSAMPITLASYNRIFSRQVATTKSIGHIIRGFETMLEKEFNDERRRVVRSYIDLIKEVLETPEPLPVIPQALEQAARQLLPQNEEAKARRTAIIKNRLDALGMKVAQLAGHMGCTRQNIDHFFKHGFNSKAFQHACNSLGIDEQGHALAEMPEWIVQLQHRVEREQQESQQVRQAKDAQIASYAGAIRRLHFIRGIEQPASPIDLKRSSKERLDQFAQRLDFSDVESLADHLEKHGNKSRGLDYFETSQLGGAVKELGAAITVLRTYWGIKPELLIEKFPDPSQAITAGIMYALSNPINTYGMTEETRQRLNIETHVFGFPSQMTLCNILAALYVFDQEQPKEKQLFQNSHALEFLAWAIERKDPHFTFTQRLKVRVEQAINDVMEAAEKVEDALVPLGGVKSVGVFANGIKSRRASSRLP